MAEEQLTPESPQSQQSTVIQINPHASQQAPPIVKENMLKKAYNYFTPIGIVLTVLVVVFSAGCGWQEQKPKSEPKSNSKSEQAVALGILDKSQKDTQQTVLFLQEQLKNCIDNKTESLRKSEKSTK